MNTMIDTHVRAVLTHTGKAVYGIVRSVSPDGYIEIRRDDGAPAVINTAKAVSIEPWSELPPSAPGIERNF
jgi:hypothetical protein